MCRVVYHDGMDTNMTPDEQTTPDEHPNLTYTVEIAYPDDGSLARDAELGALAKEFGGVHIYSGYGGGSRDIGYEVRTRDDALNLIRTFRAKEMEGVELLFVKRYGLLPVDDSEEGPTYLGGFLSEHTPADDPDIHDFHLALYDEA